MADEQQSNEPTIEEITSQTPELVAATDTPVVIKDGSLKITSPVQLVEEHLANGKWRYTLSDSTKTVKVIDVIPENGKGWRHSDLVKPYVTVHFE